MHADEIVMLVIPTEGAAGELAISLDASLVDLHGAICTLFGISTEASFRFALNPPARIGRPRFSEYRNPGADPIDPENSDYSLVTLRSLSLVTEQVMQYALLNHGVYYIRILKVMRRPSGTRAKHSARSRRNAWLAEGRDEKPQPENEE
jgi:hypothetical protein